MLPSRQARPILPRGYPDHPIKPIGSSSKKPKTKKNKKKTSMQASTFEMQSSWSDGNELNLLMDSTRHDAADLAQLPESLAWSILGMKIDGKGGKKPKKKVERKKKPNAMPRAKRVFTACPDCGAKMHVRNVFCPGCRLSKAEIKKKKAAKAANRRK